ncbi:beta strand repeat-containing protein [Caulobacter segnis]
MNGENRFIAQAVSLALTSGKTAFTSSYGSLSVADATKAAYNIIIGNAAAAAAGVNVDNAVAFLTSTTSIAYYTAFVKANVPGLTTQADIDLAVKAAIVGEILYVATSYNNGAGLGSYATASTNLIKDLADDGHLTANNAAGVDLFGAYGPGGVGSSFTLTAGIDTVTGTSGNDTIVGNTAAGALALTTLDTIDGGQGNDTLTLSVVGAVDTTTAVSTTIKNVETVNVVSTGGVTVDSSAWAGVTALNVNGAIGAINVDAAGTTAVKVVAAAGAGGVAIDGGSTVNATITNVSGGATTVIGGATAAAGNITASVAVAAAATAGALSATTEGGTSISLTQTKGSAGSTTDAANAIDGAAAAGKLGTLTTVALDGNNGGSVTSNALTSLSLANNTGTVNLTNNYGTGNATTTLGLTVNNAGGTLNDASAVYSTINITTTGKASSLTLTDTALKTLSTAGTQKLTLGTVPTSVTAYTGSGTGSLSATLALL